MLSKWVRKYDGKCQKHTHFQAKVPYDKERFDLRCAVPLYNGIMLYEKLPSKEELWLHGCARTTEAIRRAIQDSKESIAKLSERYSFNPKTIIKWKKRSFTKDVAMGPKQPKF